MDSKKNSIVPLKLKVSFQDSDRPAQVIEKEMTLCRDEDFLIQCPNLECVDGGFDLRGVNISNQAQPKPLVCSGWQDRERINKHRCLCELHFQVVG